MNAFAKLVKPYIVWITLFIVIPLCMIVLYAFTKDGRLLSFSFTIDNFLRFFKDDIFPSVLWKSLVISFNTTIICIILGYAIAYGIAKMKSHQQAMIILLITLPMWINMLVRTYAWRGILSNTSSSPALKVYIGMVYNFLPFMILQIHGALSKMDNSLIQASYDLGANKLQTFLHVVLPLSMPGVLSGITLVFLPAVSSFFIPKLLGGGSFVLVGNLIENYFINTNDWNFGSAISLIMAVVVLVSMAITKKMDTKVSEGEDD